MSIFKVTSQDFQSITVATNPIRYYSSSSSGITGSLRVFSRKTFVEKDIEEEDNPQTPYNESSLFNTWNDLKTNSKNSNGTLKKNIFDSFIPKEENKGYLHSVNNAPLSIRKQKLLNVVRFTPTSLPSTGTLAKLAIKNNLSSYYRTMYPSAHWGYCNYHSLNFFSSSTVPTSSVLLYPSNNSNKSNDRYLLTGAFSLDFHINPRYNSLDSSGHFKAGTIFHLSSSYALSLVTGSLKDENGLPLGFRLQLQLERDAKIPPSTVTKGNVFLSNDNCLRFNHWHHVVVRWGTKKVNHGTGSFVIDGVEQGTFNVFSSSLLRPVYSSGAESNILCIGNYYEGTNSGADKVNNFFNNYIASREGLEYPLGGTIDPVNFKFNHPLQAEVHNLAIKKFYVTDNDIAASGSVGLTDLKNVAFYLPPFFTFDSPPRYDPGNSYSKTQGVLYSPSIKIQGITTTPFSVPMAFGADGHYINTENFLKDFANDILPRQMFLSASLVPAGTSGTANEILYEQPQVRKRNLTILPCDDGTFYPNYDIFQVTGSNISITDRSNSSNVTYVLNQDPKKVSYIDDLGNYLEGFISLNNMASTGSWSKNNSEDFYIAENIAPTTKDPTKNFKGLSNTKAQKAGTPLFQLGLDNLYLIQHKETPYEISYKQQDGSSNQVTFFDISNLFYGQRILPGSFTITDSNMKGSGGAVKITIKDDGFGTLYRANSFTPHCAWNSVGTIFYNEGIIAIKSPHLYFFGENQYEMSFKGEQNLHVLRLETLAPTNYLNSSSNPSYRSTPSTNRPNESDANFVYITGINFHDDNLNVVMKTQLAQPIMKRHSEKILFKVKYDF